jgi:hypothetical protein
MRALLGHCRLRSEAEDDRAMLEELVYTRACEHAGVPADEELVPEP